MCSTGSVSAFPLTANPRERQGTVDEEGIADFHLAEDVRWQERDYRRWAAVSVSVSVAVGAAGVGAAFIEVAPDVFIADQAAEVVGRRGVAGSAWVEQFRAVIGQEVVGVASRMSAGSGRRIATRLRAAHPRR